MTANPEDTRRILDLLAQGKISAEEAHQLIAALYESASSAEPPKAAGEPKADSQRPTPRFLRITVTKAPNEWRHHGKTVNIRVPMSLIRGGIKLGALVPGLSDHWSDKLNARLRPGAPPIDFSKLNADELEQVLREIDELSIEVDGGREQVQFHCE